MAAQAKCGGDEARAEGEEGPDQTRPDSASSSCEALGRGKITLDGGMSHPKPSASPADGRGWRCDDAPDGLALRGDADAPTRSGGVPMLRSRAQLLVPALLLMTLSPIDTAHSARGTATRSVVWAKHGMVCAAQPLAVQAGLEMLKQGGTAVDAAIAVNACLGLMEPTANGMGGDLFAIVWDPKAKKLAGLNASGRAPLALTVDKVPADKDGTIPLYSPYSWTVPGCADGWFELHKRYGRLPMKELLAPAIRYAEEGYALSRVR